jgi:hypothetical protein
MLLKQIKMPQNIILADLFHIFLFLILNNPPITRDITQAINEAPLIKLRNNLKYAAKMRAGLNCLT